MKTFLLLLTLSFSQIAFSLTDAQIQKSFESMEKSGMFTQEQLKAAKERLENMTPEEREKLIEQGKQKLSDPEYQKKAQELLEQYKKTNTQEGKK